MISLLTRRLRLLMLVLLPAHPSTAAEPVRDYRLSAAVYQWYGELDQGRLPQSLLMTNASLSLPEYHSSLSADGTGYSAADISVGAHHLLTITPGPLEAGLQSVLVSMEFQRPSPDGQSRGQYLETRLYFDPETWLLSRLESVYRELDDFDSRFREASTVNLIRAQIYRWTAQLDKPQPGLAGIVFAPGAKFIAAEPGIDNAADYLDFLRRLQHQYSRREIRNLTLNPTNRPDAFDVSFEYQWRARNHNGEEELARIGVQLHLVVTEGRAQILEYREQYLPPVTDLGAEIRC